MPRRFVKETMPYAQGNDWEGIEQRQFPDRREEDRRAPWTDERERQYQRELAERRQYGVSQPEVQRINQRIMEEDRRQQERRQENVNAPIPCPACKAGILQGPACNRCGTTIEEILSKPTSRETKTENPSDPDDVNKRTEEFGTEDSVLDALEEKVVPEGKKKKADVSNPPGAQPFEQQKTSNPPGAIVPPAEGGPSIPPDMPVPTKETAQPFVGYEGVETGNTAVDQQIQMEIANRGLSSEMARQRALELQQNALRKQHQEGWAPQNIYQLLQPTASRNPVGRILSQFDEGFVSTATIRRAKRILGMGGGEYLQELEMAYRIAIAAGDRREAEMLRKLIQEHMDRPGTTTFPSEWT